MDIHDKRKFVEDIKGEVSCFHPLLENILPKLPNVESYEYTQGQFERGADFVLKIKNATTGRSAFVGVVVKVGKISSSVVRDIEEQINECSEDRFYKVLNKVSCSQVWVISSSGYSERAKEKLTHKFQGKSIDFFGSEEIVEWIDKYCPYYWHQLPNKLGDYLRDLDNSIAMLEKRSGLVNYFHGNDDDLYIELDTFEKVQKSYLQKNSHSIEYRNVDFFKVVLENKVSLLEAEMGFGKSKLCRRLVSILCSAQSVKEKKVLPIYSSFRDFCERFNSSLKVLIDSKIDSESIESLNGDLELFIVLDGIDECSSVERPTSEIFDDVVAQCKDIKNCKILITTRPLKSLNDKAGLYKEAKIYGIRPLSLVKIVKYLQTACAKSNLPSRLFEDLKRSQLFKQLPQSPIAAALFSNLLNENQQEVPQNLTELYSKSLELMLGRWDLKKDLATEKEFKTAQLISEVIAQFFVENKLIYLAHSEAKSIVEDYLKRRNTGVSQEVIEDIIFCRSNIFNVDEDSGVVSFRHRSFAEFLYAQKKTKDRSLPIVETALDPYWTNIFFFYSGLLLDCPEALAAVREHKPINEAESWMKTIAVPSYLMAAYQTEFEVLECSLSDVLLEASQLFLKIRSGDTESKLKELPEMHLLYLFKLLISENIGYDFFKKGFDNLIKDLDSRDNFEEKVFAIFFLGCAELDLGGDKCFRYVMDRYGVENLPISLSLAVCSETESKNNLGKSRVIKKHIEKLKKILMPPKSCKIEFKTNQHRIDELYKKPVSKRNFS